MPSIISEPERRPWTIENLKQQDGYINPETLGRFKMGDE